MRVLIDLTSLADNYSGIERFASSISLELIQNKNVEYILLFKGAIHPYFEKYSTEKHIRMIVLPRCNKFVFNQFVLPLAICPIKADCFLFLAFPVPVLLFKKNMVSTIHDICCWDCPETMNFFSSVYFRISHRVAMLKCRAMITISKFSRQRIVDRCHYGENKLWLIYCGVDEKFCCFTEATSEPVCLREKYGLHGKYILSLSTIEPRKNIRLLIQAYRRLVIDEGFSIPLVLVGRKGWKMDDLMDGIEEAVKKQICFTGFVDDEELPAIYSNAEFFVYPSKYEGFGIPPLEALACGTPVLSSDAASLPEVLGDCAEYFMNNNEDDLVEKMKTMIASASTLRSSRLRKHTEGFCWGEQTLVLLEHLQSMLS